MKPGLRHFFDSMAQYLAQPSALERLQAAHPGWRAPRTRMELYGEYGQDVVRQTLEKLFPLTQKSLGAEPWLALARAYVATRPARHYELNRLGEGFPAFVADRAAADGLPAFIPALVRFEWTDFAVYASEEVTPRRVERLTVNPTLVVLQHPFQLCAYVRAKGAAMAPEPGEEMVLMWRHPEQLLTMYMAASERSLLVLKMAVEGLSPADVAAATGVAEEDIRAAVDGCVQDGLALAPSAREPA